MTDKVKKLVLLNLPYLIFVYLFDKLCQGVRLSPGAAASEKLLHCDLFHENPPLKCWNRIGAQK